MFTDQPNNTSPNRDGPRVLWYGPVDKIGSNLAALPRVVFVTINSILVCQPSGGVTRTVSVDKLAEVVLAPPTVVRLIVAQEADLVVSTQTQKDRDDLMEAILRAFHETCGESSELPISHASHLQLSGGTSPVGHTAQFQSSSRLSPVHSFESPSNSGVGSSLRNILSRVDDDRQEIVGSRPSQNFEEIRQKRSQGDDATTTLRHQVETQKRIIEQLQLDSESGAQVDSLKRELQQARALIADLQIALRSQESAFSEMVKANEALKASETGRMAMESQLRALKDELQSTKSDVARRDQQEEDWRRKFSALESAHRQELQAVRDAFAKYDEQVTVYIDQMKSDHDAALRDLLQQKDTLLVRQGELLAKVENLEKDKKATETQRNLLTGAVWRPQLPQTLQRTPQETSDEIRSALVAKLNRYMDPAQIRADDEIRPRTPRRHTSPSSNRIRDRSIL